MDNLRPRLKNQFEVQVTALQLSIYLTVQSFRNILLKLFSQPWSGQVVVGVVKVNTWGREGAGAEGQGVENLHLSSLTDATRRPLQSSTCE